jgi:hypothetical protein
VFRKINHEAFFPPGLHPEAVYDLRLAAGGGELACLFLVASGSPESVCSRLIAEISDCYMLVFIGKLRRRYGLLEFVSGSV